MSSSRNKIFDGRGKPVEVINPRTLFDDCYDFVIDKALKAFCDSRCTEMEKCYCKSLCADYLKFKDKLTEE